jgi:hypothetical protein
MIKKDTPIQALAKAILLTEWLHILKKEQLKEIAKAAYYAQILAQNESLVNKKNKTTDFLKKFIDIRTPQCQILCLLGGSVVIAGGYTLLAPHWTTDFFMRRVLIKTPKALVPVVNGAIPVVAETVKNIVVQQAICKAVQYSAELAMSKELVCLLPLLGHPGMAPIVEAVIRTSILKNGHINMKFGGLNHTKFNHTPNPNFFK